MDLKEMEHFDRELATGLGMDMTDEVFLRDYEALRGVWKGRWGKPGPMPEATWLQLWREQQDRLAAAPAAAAEESDDSAEKPQRRTKKTLQPA